MRSSFERTESFYDKTLPFERSVVLPQYKKLSYKKLFSTLLKRLYSFLSAMSINTG